jgi:hypothetical protein
MNSRVRKIAIERQSFYENAGIKVAAALRRGGSPVQIDRRSEIGSGQKRTLIGMAPRLSCWPSSS